MHVIYCECCSVGLSDHFNAVEKLLKAGKAANRQLRSQLKEIAQLLVFQHLHSDPVAPLACIHRDDGDVEFMNTLANQLTPHVSHMAQLMMVL